MFEYVPVLLQGLPISLSLTLAALLIAFILALLFTVILTLKTPLLALLVRGYITLFTGTPLLIQIFLIYYGPGQFDFIQQLGPIWVMLSNPWFCAMIALALNSAAYSTLLFSGAMRSIPIGQSQACAALGMSQWQILRILLPYAIKRALSSYSNEVILIFKSTSLAYTITLMEIMGQAKYLYGNNYDLRVLFVAGLIYLAINGALTLLMRLIERRALIFERR